MSKKQTIVANIQLHTQQFTDLSFADLQAWVIWQFPRPTKRGLCGAVRPPLANSQWYPALVQVAEKRVHVYAHLGQQFDTPETAADYIEEIAGSPPKISR